MQFPIVTVGDEMLLGEMMPPEGQPGLLPLPQGGPLLLGLLRLLDLQLQEL